MPYYPNIPPRVGTGATVGAKPYLTGVSLFPLNVTMSAGTQQLRASATFSGTNGLVTGVLAPTFLSWSSSNTTYLTVAQTGLVTWVSGNYTSPVTTYISASGNGSVLGTVSIAASNAAPAALAPLIPESGTVLAHIWTSGTTVVDTVAGHTWHVGSNITFNAASGTWPFPMSMKGWGTASLNVLSGAADYMNTANPFTFAVIFGGIGSAGGAYIFSDMVDTVGGWGIYSTGNGGKVEIVRYNGNLAAGVNITPIVGDTGTPGLAVGGFDGTKWWLRVNSSSLASNTTTGPGTGGTRKFVVGAASDATQPWPNTSPIAELYVSNVTPTSASLAALYNAISGALSGAVP